MKIQFIGSGDAFGSGGRFNTCFYVHADHSNFLIDCGASSMVALKANRIELNDIRLILVTHFHADHFGGIPFFILDAQLISKRTQPLTIAGPKGLKEWIERAMETGFPGSSKTKQKFDLSIVELTDRRLAILNGLRITPFGVNHGMPDDSCFAYRIEVDDRIIAYTGDTEWTGNLIEVGRDADLFIAEAYFYDKNVRNHLTYATIVDHLEEINPKRLVLTHMSNDMLSKVSDIPYETAEDGKIIEI
ncbi:MAG TPA: MBL fold metallo-hydrolase [Deltaproteobacteria bacterium]|nr:MBL fold metallo-hydrolase [Deltaproteobacteria bacterium]